MKINFERMDCMSVRENSLRIYDTKRTFFSKIGSTFSKIFEPTREGINNLIKTDEGKKIIKEKLEIMLLLSLKKMQWEDIIISFI